MKNIVGSVALSLASLTFIGCAATQADEPAAASAQAASTADGLGTLTGRVTAPKAFQAAKVTAHNLDRNVKYTVFTGQGRYRAVKMFPGRYTVTVVKPGFATTRQNVTIDPGSSVNLDFSLATAPVEDDYVGGMFYPGAKILPYDEIYPAGRGRDIIERTCQGCHTVQLFPYNVKRTYPTGRNLKDRASWTITVDRMHKGPAFGERGVGYFDPKLLQPGDREILIDYLATNFGVDSEPRVVKKEIPDPPLDEAALSKAMFVEYMFPNVEGQPERFTQEIDFREGNVYITDRGLPGLVRLDPRTGKYDDFTGHGGGHGIMVDLDESIWYSGDVIRRYNPSVGTRDSYVIEGERGLGANTFKFDSKGDLWLSLLGGGSLGKWDRETDTITYWRVPEPEAGRTWGLSRPYGLVVDHNDRVWFSDYHRSSVTMFDPATEQFRSYKITDLEPTNIRRLGADSNNWIWVSTWGRPNLRLGGAIYGLNPETGAVREYPVGIPYANPYDTQADDNDIIWASTDNYLVRLDPKTGKLTRYPTPVRTDMPKMTIARNGGIWFAERNAGQSGSYGGNATVLYPDKDAITELAAYFSAKSPANRLSLYRGPVGPKVQGVIKQSPRGAQNSATPARPTAPVILGPVKQDKANAYLE
jgi:virginiamycin B lyase